MAREWLRELRKSRGFTQQRMAEMLGMSRQYYFLIEHGGRKAKLDITLAMELSQILGISLKRICDNESA